MQITLKIRSPKFNGNKVENSSKNYEQCLIESIKCHHNDIADYIENNLMYQTEKDSRQEEEIISNSIKYHNYSHFKINDIINYGFFYLSFYHYDKLFNHLLKEKEELIEKKLIKYPSIKAAKENNEVEVIYHYLVEKQEISNKFFERIPICTKIVIPSSYTKIGAFTFNRCLSLK